jgi:hypothetical protein
VRILTDGAWRGRRCELFTNAIGGERRDFAGYVANVAADPAAIRVDLLPGKVDWQLAGQGAMKADRAGGRGGKGRPLKHSFTTKFIKPLNWGHGS